MVQSRINPVSVPLSSIYEDLMMNNINENIFFTYHIVIAPTKEFQPEYKLHWDQLKEVFEKLCTTHQIVKAMIFEMTEVWLFADCFAVIQ